MATIKELKVFFKYLFRNGYLNLEKANKPKNWYRLMGSLALIPLLFTIAYTAVGQISLAKNYLVTTTVMLIVMSIFYIWYKWVQGDWKHELYYQK